jgi:glucosamine kinase
MPRFVLGVDGGGTKTLAAIADERGRILGTGRAGPTNPDVVGEEELAANLGSAVREARELAGLGSRPFAAVFLGLAGVVTESDRRHVQSIVARGALGDAGSLEVDHDIRIALAGGLAGRPGIALIAGTGSSCYGRKADGSSWQAGGWGHLFADEGSGYWLGFNVVKAAFRMYDGRSAETELKSRVLELLGLPSMPDIMHRVYVSGMNRAEIAGLAPRVLQLAREGDETCRALVAEGARELAECVFAVADRLRFAPGELEITHAGGLLGPGSPLLSAVRERIAGWSASARVTEPELPPVLGACLLALRQVALDHAAVLDNLTQQGATVTREQ